MGGKVKVFIMEENNLNYKCCIVPECPNNSMDFPKKLFFPVPSVNETRNNRCSVLRQDGKERNNLSSMSEVSSFCCEDHFTSEDDVENYEQCKSSNQVGELKLKSDVLPHHCQKETKEETQRETIDSRLEEEVSEIKVISSGTDSSDVTDASLMDCEFEVCENLKGNTVKEEHNVSDKMDETNRTFESTGSSAIKFQDKEADSPVKFISPDETEESVLSSDESRNSSSEEDDGDDLLKEQMCKNTILYIEKKPELFLGIPKKSLFLIELLQNHSNLPLKNIYVVLKKIRLNPPFEVLAIDFGMSKSELSEMFFESLPSISNILESLITWPSDEKVLMNLPIPFRLHYHKVRAIIDCLEIKIERPSDSAHQSLTWSNYYKCHTIKYLVSFTPDGLLNYVSKGIGGKASDALIFEESDIIEKLSPGNHIMAIRRFKDVEEVLEGLNITLVRPPSVRATTCKSKLEVVRLKNLAVLRAHIERVIRRTRDFKMLSPHSCIEESFVGYLDFIVAAACGLINIQESVFVYKKIPR